MFVTAQLLFVAALCQGVMWLAYVASQAPVADALDRPLPGAEDRDSHVHAAWRALARTIPLAVVAVAVVAALTRPALSVFMPTLTGERVDPRELVQGTFAAVYVSGVGLAAVLVTVTVDLLVRLRQLRSAR